MRWHIEKRDKGICAECGADTEAQRAEYVRLNKKHGTVYCKPMEEYRKQVGITASRGASYSWWEADHILPVIEGGGEVRT